MIERVSLFPMLFISANEIRKSNNDRKSFFDPVRPVHELCLVSETLCGKL